MPFEIRIFRTEYGTWKVQVHNGDHNHDASINDSEHSEYTAGLQMWKFHLRTSYSQDTRPATKGSLY
jgi:hypothetical protein